MTRPTDEVLWAQYAAAALTGYTAYVYRQQDEVGTAAELADAMLAEHRRRWPAEAPSAPSASLDRWTDAYEVGDRVEVDAGWGHVVAATVRAIAREFYGAIEVPVLTVQEADHGHFTVYRNPSQVRRLAPRSAS